LTFVDRLGAKPGHVVSIMGVRGGFSSLMIQLEPNADRVELLAGVADTERHGAAVLVLRDFLKRHSWVGPVIFGGGGRIPIRRPYDRLGAGGMVLVGDAACQVFPGHASGVGSGLIAARVLAEVMDRFEDPGSMQAIWDYQATFHRERGGIHAAYELMQRATQRLNSDDIEALMGTGLIEPENSRVALEQKLAQHGLKDAMQLLVAASRTPQKSASLLSSAIRMPLMEKLYAMYPQTPNDKALARWIRAVELLRGGG
jgi:flavin-dependent dehydrogenase